MLREGDFGDFFMVKIFPFIMIRGKIPEDKANNAIEITKLSNYTAPDEPSMYSQLEQHIFTNNGFYYRFTSKSKITKRYIGETMLMLCSIRNKTTAPYEKLELKFSAKDNISHSPELLKRLVMADLKSGNILYFPAHLYIKSEDYLLEINIDFQTKEKRVDSDPITNHFRVTKPFKLSPKTAVDVSINYAQIDQKDSKETFVTVKLTNTVNFPLTIKHVDYEESECYKLNRMYPEPQQIVLTEKQSYTVVLGCMLNQEHNFPGKSTLGDLTVIWHPNGEISEGGSMGYQLFYTPPSARGDLTLSCEENKITYGKSLMTSVTLRNNTNSILYLRLSNRDKNSGVAIHKIDAEDVVKVDPRREIVFWMLLYGRKRGIHKLTSLKISSALKGRAGSGGNSETGYVYNPLEFQIDD